MMSNRGFVQYAITYALLAFPLLVIGQPLRIASINLCTDQLLVLLADPSQIVSVSYFSRDPLLSGVASQAINLPINHGLAEEIIPLKPDIILTGQFSNRATMSILRRLGYSVYEIDMAKNIQDIHLNIKRVGQLISQDKKATHLIETMNKELAEILENKEIGKPVAAFYEPNGYSVGVNTLAHDILKISGYRNLGEIINMPTNGVISLESIIKHAPDVLIMDVISDKPSLATNLLNHPVLKNYYDHPKILYMPKKYVTCGSPIINKAIALLRNFKIR